MFHIWWSYTTQTWWARDVKNLRTVQYRFYWQIPQRKLQRRVTHGG